MVGDHADDTVAGALDAVVGETDELDVVVGEGLDVALAADGGFVAFHQLLDVLSLVGRTDRIGGIAQHDHDGLVPFDLRRGVGLIGDEPGEAKSLGLGDGLLQRVGEVDAQPLVAREVVAGLLQEDAQLHVSHGVGGHQQLEAEDAGQEFLRHVATPPPFAHRPGYGLVDLLDDEVEEGRRANGRVEDEGVGVGQAQGAVEAGFHDVIEGADNVGDHWLRGVIDAAGFARLGIVGAKKGLVEVDHWILLPRPPAEVAQDLCHVRPGQQVCQVVHQPGNAVVQSRPSDLIEEPAQKGIGLGQVPGRLLTGEILPGRDADAGSEEAVGDGLSVHVGELGRGEEGDQRLSEGFQLGVQHTLFALLLEGLLDEIAGHAGQSRHALGQLLGSAHRGRRLGQELLQQPRNGLDASPSCPDPPINGQRSQAGRLPVLALHVPAELQVVGEDQIVERFAVAAHLLGPRRRVQAPSHVLGLDVADGRTGAGDDVIGRPAVHALGLVDGGDVLADGFKEGFESRAVGVFGGAPRRQALLYASQVISENIRGHITPANEHTCSRLRSETSAIGIPLPVLPQGPKTAKAGRWSLGNFCRAEAAFSSIARSNS